MGPNFHFLLYETSAVWEFPLLVTQLRQFTRNSRQVNSGGKATGYLTLDALLLVTQLRLLIYSVHLFHLL